MEKKKGTKKNGWETIEDVCQQHRAKHYFDDGEGLLGVYNHANVVCWYRYIPDVGYSLVGSTATPEGAQMRRLEREPGSPARRLHRQGKEVKE